MMNSLAAKRQSPRYCSAPSSRRAWRCRCGRAPGIPRRTLFYGWRRTSSCSPAPAGNAPTTGSGARSRWRAPASTAFSEKARRGSVFPPSRSRRPRTLLRVAVPVYIIIRGAYYREGLVFLAVFILFWLVHLHWTACPHCINAACPLNPDYRG